MAIAYEAALGAVEGIGKSISGVISALGNKKAASKALGIQRDIANRELALKEAGLELAQAESDKERQDSNYKMNRLLEFYSDQGNAARELAALGAGADNQAGGGLSPWLLLAGGAVLVFFVMGKGK
jgi:hypothetical protein